MNARLLAAHVDAYLTQLRRQTTARSPTPFSSRSSLLRPASSSRRSCRATRCSSPPARSLPPARCRSKCIVVVLIVAAVVGDAVNYSVGRRAGAHLSRRRSRYRLDLQGGQARARAARARVLREAWRQGGRARAVRADRAHLRAVRRRRRQDDLSHVRDLQRHRRHPVGWYLRRARAIFSATFRSSRRTSSWWCSASSPCRCCRS